MAIQRSTRSRAVRAASLIALGLAVPVAQASDCPLRDVSGQWRAVSSNATEDSTSPWFDVRQAGNSFEGEAFYTVSARDDVSVGVDERRVNGTLEGRLDGDSIDFTVYWDNNSIGVYTGTVGPQGRLEGTGYDRRNPRTQAEWYSQRAMPCLAGAQSDGQAPVPRAPDPANPLERKRSPLPAPAVPLGRKQAPPAVPLGRVQSPPVPLGRVQGTVGAPAPGSICQSAASARARNSPAAAGLERQCQVYEANLLAARQSAPPAPTGGAPEPVDDPAPDADDGVIQPAGTNRADAHLASVWVSQLRQQNDLDDVIEDPALTAIALEHSKNMVAASQLTHNAPGESPLDARAAAGGFSGQLIHASDQGFDFVFKAWDQMPVQRAKLLSPTSRRIGIAALNATTGNTSRLYWTLVIGD